MKLTGPMSVRGRSSRTFSIGDLLGSIGGGLIRVAEGIAKREGPLAVCLYHYQTEEGNIYCPGRFYRY